MNWRLAQVGERLQNKTNKQAPQGRALPLSVWVHLESAFVDTCAHSFEK
jgi:hypothetical protein